jgi:hypothetical protein
MRMSFTRYSVPTVFLIKEFLKKQHDNTKHPHDPDNYLKNPCESTKISSNAIFFFFVFSKIKYVF